jgi:hypothetical protein
MSEESKAAKCGTHPRNKGGANAGADTSDGSSGHGEAAAAAPPVRKKARLPPAAQDGSAHGLVKAAAAAPAASVLGGAVANSKPSVSHSSSSSPFSSSKSLSYLVLLQLRLTLALDIDSLPIFQKAGLVSQLPFIATIFQHHPTFVFFQSHLAWAEPSFQSLLREHDFANDILAHPVCCLASRISVHRWEGLFLRQKQAHPLPWNVHGFDIETRQRWALQTRGACCEVLVLRLLLFQGGVPSKRLLNLATRVLSRRHLLGSKNQTDCLFAEGQRLYGQRRFMEAANSWGQAALLKHGPSHAFLSDMLIDNPMEIRKWSGYVPLQGHLGARYNHSSTNKLAFRLASAGALLGCAHSKGALARCYMSGIGVFDSWNAAGPLAKESADTGSCIGQFVMGLQALIEHSDVEAAVWFYQAAEQGHATSQFNLGLMFLEGKGVPQDTTEATRWLEKASAQGHVEAHNAVPKRRRGVGVAKY